MRNPDCTSPNEPKRFLTVKELQAQSDFHEEDWVETTGFHAPADGGGARYQIQKISPETKPNGADVLKLKNGWVAVLRERKAVNYRMFGALSNGASDDGVQIKQAHEYANKHQVPMVNLSGEFWIIQTNDIPITTNAHWGKTTIHIDERHNDPIKPRFVVKNDQPTEDLTLDPDMKTALLEKIRPGVQIISELAPYAGHLISVVDSEDRIGIRSGAKFSKQGWAREELFYVEEEGRIIGDIAWSFSNFTSVTATPCNKNYLVVEGGSFHFSGHTPLGDHQGYYQHGISIQRSRTIVREQWMGLEKGMKDVSLEPRRGFYTLNGVYDVTLENIRAMPWEYTREDKNLSVKHGTYGIGGARMLNCTFRNLTAEAGWASWGVFGTNLNKNFRVENCRLNRIDVHFHCWNLTISNCTIGFKGISVTGGGKLLIENTTRHGNDFIRFRPDYGSRWDGPIRLRGCTLKPCDDKGVKVLSFKPDNFDYQYPLGFGSSIEIEDLAIDYSAAPNSESPCWLMDIVAFSKTDSQARLFFPNRVSFRRIMVEGRKKGVRLMRIPHPYHYDLPRSGSYDGSRLKNNCTLTCAQVQLEQLTPERLGDSENVHLQIGEESASEYADDQALYPKLFFSDCEGVCLLLSQCIASAVFEHCTVNSVTASDLRGELVFSHCQFQPDTQNLPEHFYRVRSSLGTRFTNCTLHAPVVNGIVQPEMLNRLGFVEINRSVDHYHLNTSLSHDVVDYLKSQEVVLSPRFVAMLTAHHALDDTILPDNA